MKYFSITKCGATLGEGVYSKKSHPEYYQIWYNMLQRCYDEHFIKQHTSYIGCSVCCDWLNFQNFAAWCNHQNAPKGWQLDKDIRIKDNKIYSPETCGFVPEVINKIFVRQKRTKNNLPLGVYYKPRYYRNGEFSHLDIFAACKDANGKQVHLGYFKSITEASVSYNQFKKNVIVMAANKYRGELSETMYNALINYSL